MQINWTKIVDGDKTSLPQATRRQHAVVNGDVFPRVLFYWPNQERWTDQFFETIEGVTHHAPWPIFTDPELIEPKPHPHESETGC